MDYTPENIIDATAKELAYYVRMNQNKPEELKIVHTATAVHEDDRFIVVNGSAHRMKDLFIEFFKQRPEMVGVAREAINESYRYLE